MDKKMLKKKVVSSFMIVLLMMTALTPVTNTWAKQKSGSFKLSTKNIMISENKDVSIISNKKNEKINITVDRPDIAAVMQKSQKGKKTVFTVMPKMKGSTKVVFRAGKKKKTTLKVTVNKTSFETIKNGFSAQLTGTSAGLTGAVHIMVHNHTGVKAYCSNLIVLHGDMDYDGHWFDPSADFAAQSTVQYAEVGENEDRQLDYFNAPVYGLRFAQSYKVMSFQTQAYAVMTVYFDEPAATNAYKVTVNNNGITGFEKL